ncbi:Short-chain dehydrogenase/reductase SDR [Penicillium taxi]|uniref:Short-chain dehydrogenase/reductase SDR n=1 Tax=Penicillium taxi TaxID=168475 RepID=UPI0025456789|nr:Short-chain dehydrogenase/reductase SDR [Penicillium taxi]KAJ5902568.1 Short-chain dehydrogenase/reductase SDR [Penicillium taxi]
MPSFFYSQFFVRPSYPTQSFEGQTVLVSGSNVGLGLEATRHVVRLGAAKVIMAVRNVKAGEAAKEDIEKSTGRNVCEVWEMDLASHSSVLAFGERISQLPRLDAAIMNAALATNNFELVGTYEKTITVNVINTLLLSLLILPTLKATKMQFPSSQPHLSLVVSEVHGWVDFPEWKADEPLKVISDPATAKMTDRYPLSKLLEVLLVQELAGRVKGSEVIITMVNPGLCHSALAREAGIGLAVMKFFMARTTEIGSRTLIAGISTGIEGHGAYMSDGYTCNTNLSPFVRSEEGRQAREKLWGQVTTILEGYKPGVTRVV